MKKNTRTPLGRIVFQNVDGLNHLNTVSAIDVVLRSFGAFNNTGWPF